MKKALSIVLCLSMLMMSFPVSVFAAPEMAPVIDETTQEEPVKVPAEDGETLIPLGNSETGWTVTYVAGTGDEVEGVPASDTAKFDYAVSKAVPTRDGFTFEGWSLIPGGTEAVTELYVEDDVTLYAMWSKGTTFLDFKKASDYNNHIAVNFADKNSVEVDTSGDGYLTFKTVQGKSDTVQVVLYGNKTSPYKNKVIPLDDVSSIEIKLATDYQNTNGRNVPLYYVTQDGNGTQHNSLSGTYAFRDNVKYSGNINEFVTIKVDTASSVWKDYLGLLRIDPIVGDAAAVKTVIVDYIKLNGIRTVEYVGVEMPAPVAAAEGYGLEGIVSTSDAYTIESVEWSPALLGDMFFDSATEYTAKITAKAAAGYTLSQTPASGFVNGNEADIEYVDDSLVVTYKFLATEDVGEFTLVNLSLHEVGNDGPSVVTKKLFAGDDFNLESIKPKAVADGYRWIGWSDTEGGEANTTVINLTEDGEYYAVYELIEGFDYGNKYHVEGTTTNIDGTLEVVDGWAVMTPETATDDIKLITPKTYIDAADYGKIEVVYDGSLETTVGGVLQTNKFGESLAPALYFETDEGTFEAELVEVVPCIVANKISYKYVYDMMLSDRWVGTIGSITLDPYDGYPAWAVKSIDFIKNQEIEDAAVITGITVPETWGTPDYEAAVEGNLEVVSVNWTPALNESGKFNPATAYSAVIILKPASGYKIVNDEATIDGNEALAIINTDGTMTVSYTYEATATLKPFTFELSDGGVIDTPYGAFTVAPIFTPENEGDVIDVTDFVLEIVDNGPDNNCAYIEDDGVTIKAVYNGTITIKATSVYDPTKSDTAVIVISNQDADYEITYEAGADNVTNMPATDYAKLDYELSDKIPVRSGFSFGGWIKDPDDTTSITKDFVTGDTTYYALWVSGINYEFIGETAPTFSKEFSTNGTYDKDNGVYTVSATVGDDPTITFNGNGLPGSKYPVIEVRMKTNCPSPAFTVYFTSKDAEGGYLGYPYNHPDAPSDYGNNRVSVNYTSNGEYVVVTLDMSSRSDWTGGYIDTIRLDPFERNIGSSAEFDYIRLVNYEANVVEIGGVEAPVAKKEADTTATNISNGVEVTNVSWEPELLYGYYFDGETEYTAKITVTGAAGYYVSSSPVVCTVNGEEADSYEYDAETGTLAVYKTFEATGAIDSSEAYEINLVSLDDNNNEVSEVRTFFKGDKFDLGSYCPQSIPAGFRWIGWTDIACNPVETIIVNRDAEYFAAYELLTEFDYANPNHWEGTTSKAGDEGIRFEDDHAIVEVPEKNVDTALITPVTNLVASDYCFVEVYYSATHDGELDGLKVSNIFNTTLVNPLPALMFSSVSAPDTFTGTATLVSAERVMVGSSLTYKYTYDMTTSSAWTGNIGKFYADPYTVGSSTYIHTYPEWAIRKIVFVPYETISDDIELELKAPAVWGTPVVADNVSANNKYTVNSITWDGELNESGAFMANTAYTATIVVGHQTGYTSDVSSATVNGEDAEIVRNEDGTYTVTYTFEATGELEEVEVVITGSNTITATGKYLNLKGVTKSTSGAKLPVTSVTWSIDDETIATISDNGRVYPITNGTVVVTATSVYNPEVYAEHEIVVTNQGELYTVTFDQNTDSIVNGMPEPIMTRGVFVPEDYEVTREGYFFSGWATDEDALEFEDSFTINSDTTLYAVWSKGYEWNCNDKNNILTLTSGRTATYENGIAYISVGKDQIFMSQNISELGFDTADYTQLHIRISLPNGGSLKNYAGSCEGTITSVWNETAAQLKSDLKANANGEFQVVTYDYKNHANWNMYPTAWQLRLDSPTNIDVPIAVDWIRLLDTKRTVRFDGNGGLIPLYDGYVDSYKQTYGMGEINLRSVPVKEGYVFAGWSKDPESFDKLYNGTFTVADDVTLYAMWTPGNVYYDMDEEAIAETVSVLEDEMPEDMTVTSDSDGLKITSESVVTPVIKIADEAVVTDEHKTIAVEVKYSGSDVEDDTIYLSFIPEGATEPTLVALEDLGTDYDDVVIADLSEIEEYAGTVTNVCLVLPTAVYDELVVTEVVISTPEVAEKLGSSSSSSSTDSIGKPQDVEIVGDDESSIRETEYAAGSGKIPSHAASTTKEPNKQITNTTTPSTPVNKFPFINSFSATTFTDVKSSDWFYGDVEKSYKIGLMNGKSTGVFDPNGNVTLAEAITVASRVNALYNGIKIPAATSSQKWYDPYVSYAGKTKIIKAGQFADVTRPATRSEVAVMFANAMPQSWYTAINQFTSIPDVPSSDAAYMGIIKLYNAGVIVGVDEARNFNPAANIKRSEISAIINRVVLPESRMKVYTPEQIEKMTIYYDAERLIDVGTLVGCEERSLVLKDGLAYGMAIAPTVAGNSPDPIVNLSSEVCGKGLDPTIYRTIEVGVKYGDDVPAGTIASIFFTTPDISWSGSARIDAVYSAKPNDDGICVIKFNCATNANWKNLIKNLRFDPHNKVSEFSIAYIKIIPSLN